MKDDFVKDTMKCWNCGIEHSQGVEGKLPFRAECEKCGQWLHCCYNCQFYHPGFANECKIPHTEFVRERSMLNFCEDFKLLGLGPSRKKESPKTAFDSLFKD